MKEIELYSSKCDVTDIFKALKKAKFDELLPEEGPLAFFYEYLQYPGISLFLRHKNKIKFFYIDHDNLILELKDKTPEIDISVDKNLLRIILRYEVDSSEIPLNFVFDLSNESYVDVLKVLRKKKEINLYFLTMVYGGLALDSIHKFKVPSNVVNVLKKIK